MHMHLFQGGTEIAIPAGMLVAWLAADANGKVDPLVDITGASNTDPLAAIEFGVKTVAADTSTSATLMNADGTAFKNADGTGVVVNFPFHITTDPAELSTTATGTVGTAVSQ